MSSPMSWCATRAMRRPAALAQFVHAERLEAAQVTAIGAFERAIVGWFDRAAKQYRRIPVDEQCEVLPPLRDDGGVITADRAGDVGHQGMRWVAWAAAPSTLHAYGEWLWDSSHGK